MTIAADPVFIGAIGLLLCGLALMSRRLRCRAAEQDRQPSTAASTATGVPLTAYIKRQRARDADRSSTSDPFMPVSLARTYLKEDDKA